MSFKNYGFENIIFTLSSNCFKNYDLKEYEYQTHNF